MASNEALPLCVANCSNQVVAHHSFSDTLPDIINTCYARLEFVRGGASEERNCLSMSARTDHFIVYVRFGIGFFNQRKPPPAVSRGLGEGWLVRVDWKLVIDSNELLATLYKGFHCENSLLAVAFLLEHLGDEFTTVC